MGSFCGLRAFLSLCGPFISFQGRPNSPKGHPPCWARDFALSGPLLCLFLFIQVFAQRPLRGPPPLFPLPPSSCSFLSQHSSLFEILFFFIFLISYKHKTVECTDCHCMLSVYSAMPSRPLVLSSWLFNPVDCGVHAVSKRGQRSLSLAENVPRHDPNAAS